MASTTSSATWQIARLGSNQAQAYLRTSEPIVQLAAIGDVHVVSTSFLEQFDSAVSIGSQVENATATRSFTLEFRHSTNNSTWTSWASATVGNLTAITYDPDNRAYFQWRITRTGSDASGILIWDALVLGFGYDPSAMADHGSFTDIGMLGECELFLKAVIRSKVIQYANADRFEVLSTEERQTSNGNKGLILVGNIQFTNQSWSMQRDSDWEIAADLFVKMPNKATGNMQGYIKEADLMFGILAVLFRENENNRHRFTFTFKGVDFVEAPLSALSVGKLRTTGDSVILDAPTQTTYRKLSVKFTIFAIRKLI